MAWEGFGRLSPDILYLGGLYLGISYRRNSKGNNFLSEIYQINKSINLHYVMNSLN